MAQLPQIQLIKYQIFLLKTLELKINFFLLKQNNKHHQVVYTIIMIKCLIFLNKLNNNPINKKKMMQQLQQYHRFFPNLKHTSKISNKSNLKLN